MNDTYVDEYTCAFQDTMICYRDDATRVRVPATAARLRLKRLGSQALRCPNAEMIELAEGYETLPRDLFNGLIQENKRFSALVLPASLKAVDASAGSGFYNGALRRVSLRRRMSEAGYRQLLDASLPMKGHVRLPADVLNPDSPCRLMIDVMGCFCTGVVDPARAEPPLFDAGEEDAPKLFAPKTCLLPEKYDGGNSENAALLWSIARGRLGARDADAELWNDRMLQVVDRRGAKPGVVAAIWFDERAVEHRGGGVSLTLEVSLGRLFRQALRRVRLNGMDYYVYSRLYCHSAGARPAYKREDVCVYDARGLITDPDLSEAVYEKYRLLNVL